MLFDIHGGDSLKIEGRMARRHQREKSLDNLISHGEEVTFSSLSACSRVWHLLRKKSETCTANSGWREAHRVAGPDREIV